MEYRQLPRGGEQERFSVLGIGMGGIHQCGEAEVEAIVRRAIDHGINFFDVCAGGRCVLPATGRAIAGRREEVFLQMHLGAVFNDRGEYAWSRDLGQIKEVFRWELSALGTDYADMGYLHCVDTQEDYEKLKAAGVVDYLRELKAAGTVRHMGFSSHTPAVAERLLDEGLADMLMFSINPAYDFERGDAYGVGSLSERSRLFRRCQAEGVGISVMKPFFGGKLLSAAESPFRQAMTHYQCIQYALDRPGVLTVLPGVRCMAELEALLGFAGAPGAERDYAAIGRCTPESVAGACVYCNHCQPCPAGIDIGLANRYYDLALVGDALAAGHYDKLRVRAGDCLHCGQCDQQCPFGVAQSARMEEIAAYFGK